ncbi:helix-turn-helix domain-containing protein [Synechococcales cyanobacterium C]|uniref:Helix-turn-helix domain-containing protein n=1 Tax=Petrachloros mirabilis ULC683 TaxID=2781853 RepID=A0A8K2A2G0_9CYAN|nr:helix-turn-helix domain-containing protein [Petrachloros mirabilis]NCJ08638.1 helix-turn-helix domain-containing protein [Petrachloros mirabilis ULC683]
MALKGKAGILSYSSPQTWEHAIGVPSLALRGWVNTYIGHRENFRQPVCRLEVPRPWVVLVLGFGADIGVAPVESQPHFRRYQALVFGLNEKPLLHEVKGLRSCLEITMPPWTAYQLFDGALPELAQETVALDAIWGAEADQINVQLSELSSWTERFALVDQILIKKLTTSTSRIRSEVQWAWHQLVAQGGCIAIRHLAQQIGWSHRHFAQCFREQIGITPKIAARQIRFAHAHQMLSRGEEGSLAAIAAECGYSDQSHLTREFHLFSGCSPVTYQQAHFPELPGTPGEIVWNGNLH